MKKLLPLVALLATAALSVPVMAQPAAETHKEMKKEAHPGKKHHGHKHAHKAGAAHHTAGKHHGKHHAERVAHENNQAMMHQEPRHMQPAAPEKVWLPSMRHGFQK